MKRASRKLKTHDEMIAFMFPGWRIEVENDREATYRNNDLRASIIQKKGSAYAVPFSLYLWDKGYVDAYRFLPAAVEAAREARARANPRHAKRRRNGRHNVEGPIVAVEVKDTINAWRTIQHIRGDRADFMRWVGKAWEQRTGPYGEWPTRYHVAGLNAQGEQVADNGGPAGNARSFAADGKFRNGKTRRKNGGSLPGPDALAGLAVGSRFVVRTDVLPDADSFPYTVTARKHGGTEVHAESDTGARVYFAEDSVERGTLVRVSGAGTHRVTALRRVNGRRRSR